MKKFVCENLEELKEGFYDEPGEEERVPSDVRDAMYQAGKKEFEDEDIADAGYKYADHKNENIEEELLDYFIELIVETRNYTDLDRASIEKVFQKAMNIAYEEGE